MADRPAERSFITFPTWKKYLVMASFMERLRIKDKRQLFHIMRHTDCLSHDTFFPSYGITAGEFSVWQVLSDSRRNRRGAR